MTAFPKPTRDRDAGHLAYIRSLPCVARMVEGRVTFGVDAAHVSFLGKKGFGSKVSDHFTVPLCRSHHTEQHDGLERVWWARLSIRPASLCEELVRARPSAFNGEQVIRDFAERARRLPKLVSGSDLVATDATPERVTITAHLGAGTDADGNLAVHLPTTTGTVLAHVAPEAVGRGEWEMGTSVERAEAQPSAGLQGGALLESALRRIRDLKVRPFDGFPADWAEQIAACPDCQRYKDHPIQQGICDFHRQPINARRAHDDHEERALFYRAREIAREALDFEGGERRHSAALTRLAKALQDAADLADDDLIMVANDFLVAGPDEEGLWLSLGDLREAASALSSEAQSPQSAEGRAGKDTQDDQ